MKHQEQLVQDRERVLRDLTELKGVNEGLREKISQLQSSTVNQVPKENIDLDQLRKELAEVKAEV